MRHQRQPGITRRKTCKSLFAWVCKFPHQSSNPALPALPNRCSLMVQLSWAIKLLQFFPRFNGKQSCANLENKFQYHFMLAMHIHTHHTHHTHPTYTYIPGYVRIKARARARARGRKFHLWKLKLLLSYLSVRHAYIMMYG